MAITLKLTEEQERSALESAERRDEETLRRVLTQALDVMIDKMLHNQDKKMDQDQFEVLADKLADSFASASSGPSLPEEAVTREGIYGDHP